MRPLVPLRLGLAFRPLHIGGRSSTTATATVAAAAPTTTTTTTTTTTAVRAEGGGRGKTRADPFFVSFKVPLVGQLILGERASVSAGTGKKTSRA